MSGKQLTISHGSRKTAIARVRIQPGTGKITVNNLDYLFYFKRKAIAALVRQPLESANYNEKLDVLVNVCGGGLTGQAGAVRHAIARALDEAYPETRAILKPKGFLTRDARKVERKMYGHKKSRRSFQFSKR